MLPIRLVTLPVSHMLSVVLVVRRPAIGDVRMTTVLEANASRTLESACETCENRSKTLIALVVDSWAIPRLSSRRIEMIEEDSGSRTPSLTNIRQKSFRGVGDY
jgi:hypothetical protein